MKDIINDIKNVDKEDVIAVCYSIVMIGIMWFSLAVFK